MQVNSSNFAQTYQMISRAQVVNENPATITPEQKNNVADALVSKQNEIQQAQNDTAQQKRTAATTVIDHQQTQDNIDTYVQSYQNATGSDSSTSTSNVSYGDIKDINQTITRHQVANSDMLSNYIDRQQEGAKPTPYYQAGLQNQAQAGSMINTFA